MAAMVGLTRDLSMEGMKVELFLPGRMADLHLKDDLRLDLMKDDPTKEDLKEGLREGPTKADQ
jgi:hypothetical protein